MLLRRYRYKFGISIPYNTDIGPGFYIGHFGGIVVNSEAAIGKNCNINPAVTIGTTYGGKYPGTPRILNNVYLGPGSKIIGGITIGNNAAIGANCVVTESIPDNAVAVGVPGKVFSLKGSANYIINTDY
jgi:serine O-acetyltransferase